MKNLSAQMIIAITALTACVIMNAQANAATPIETVRAAIAVDGRFPSSLYSGSFIEARRRADQIDGPTTSGGVTGLVTGAVTKISTKMVGNKVLAKIMEKYEGAPGSITKVITFFMAPDGKIADVDTNTEGKTRANGPVQHMPTLLHRYENTISDH